MFYSISTLVGYLIPNPIYTCRLYMICKWIVCRWYYFWSSQTSFVCILLNGFKYSKLLYISIWLIDGTLAGTTTQGQSGPRSNDNEGVLHILQTLRMVPHHQIYVVFEPQIIFHHVVWKLLSLFCFCWSFINKRQQINKTKYYHDSNNQSNTISIIPTL